MGLRAAALRGRLTDELDAKAQVLQVDDDLVAVVGVVMIYSVTGGAEGLARKSGGSGKKVKSRKQAIAIGLSQARKSGAKVPRKRKAAAKKR